MPRFGTFGLGGHPLGPVPLTSWHRFPRSTQEPEPSSRRLYAGHHRGRKQVSPRLRPRLTTAPGLGDVPTLSTPHRRFTCVRLLGSHLTSSWLAFSGTLTTRTFDPCSFRCFGTRSCNPIPRDLPSSLTQHGIWDVPVIVPSAFVAHNRPHNG